jgi:uncharacterized phage-associated protein
MSSRTLTETLTDRLLILFLISECQKQACRVTGKVKLLKLVYLSEGRMNQNETKGFNYGFYRWDYGPMSNEVLQDLDYLSENSLLEKTENFIGITNRGLEVLKGSTPLLNHNEELLKLIHKVIKEFGHYKGKSLKTIVYGIPKIGERILVGKTEHGAVLLQKLPLEKARKMFWIDDEWIETLSILLDKEVCDSLKRGTQDAREGRVTKYEPVKSTA